MAPGKNRWDADEYGKLAAFDGDWRDSWWDDGYLGLMAERWRLSEVHRLLDVGCGVGHWSQRLSRFLPRDAQIVGVDIEVGFREKALARADRLGLKGRFELREGSAMALPFDDDGFDMVTCQTVLMHLGDPAAAVREMARVCRPGGLVVVAEPNNFVNSLSYLAAYPRMPWSDLEPYLRFFHVCREGKQALGGGDGAVGEHLPELLSAAGLEEVAVRVNDQCPWLHPPYEQPRMRTELAQLFQFFDAGVSLTGGPKDEARRRFLAGGGAEAEFEGLWTHTLRLQHEMKTAIDAGAISAARGFLHYLAHGRRPR